MKSRKHSIFWQVIAVILMVFHLSGCGISIPGEVKQSAVHTIYDDKGIAVEVPLKPQRILPLGVSTDDIIIPLVGAERIVAVSKYPPNWPKEVEKIKNRVESKTEIILSFRPDLILVPDWYQADFISELRMMNLPVYVYTTPRNYEESKNLITHIAEIVGESERGRMLVAEGEQRMKKLAEFVGTIPEYQRKTAVFYSAQGITGGEGSLFDDMSNYVGFHNGARLLGLSQRDYATRENMIKINPDIIFLPSDSFDTKGYKSPIASMLYHDPAIQGIKAIKNKEVYVIEARWIMSYSSFMINAMEEMAKFTYGYEP